MKITFVSLFPDMLKPYFDYSVLGRAHKRGVFELEFLDLRSWAFNKHKRTDEKKIGGGAGMLMSIEPFYELFKSISPLARVIFLAPAGKPFLQKDAVRLAKEPELVLVCTRYEGVDERVIENFASEVFCMGDYILSGGELAALSLSDAVLRNVAGVLGNEESLEEESFNGDLLEAPAFTKPNVFMQQSVISELLKGNHSKIRALNLKLSELKTKYFRPKGIK